MADRGFQIPGGESTSGRSAKSMTWPITLAAHKTTRIELTSGCVAALTRSSAMLAMVKYHVGSFGAVSGSAAAIISTTANQTRRPRM
jgi:hypothetical protein